MEPRISVITLGVSNLQRSIAFYEALGWERSLREAKGVAFFQLGGLALSLYPDLAKDAGINAAGGTGAFSLSHNVREKAQVDEVVHLLHAAGGDHHGACADDGVGRPRGLSG